MAAQGNAEEDGVLRRAGRVAIAVLTAIFGSGVILSLIQANVQEWAKARSQDQYLVKYITPAASWIAETTQNTTFLAVAFFIIGSATTMWLGHAVRQRTKKMAFALLFLGIALIGASIWIFLNPQDLHIDETNQRSTRFSEAERAEIVAPYKGQIEELKKQIATISQPPTNVIPGRGSIESGFPEKREYTKKTVRELRAIYEGRTRLQADAFMADEKGKLINVEGTVVNIDSGMAFLSVGNHAPTGAVDHVECRFGSQWDVKLSTFRQGDRMIIRGVIGPNQNGAQIYLQECEIIS